MILTLVPAQALLTFKTAPTYDGTAGGDNDRTVTVTVADGAGGTDSVDVTVNIVNVNAAPVFTEGDATDDGALALDVAEGTTAVTTLAATDADAGTTLAYSISGGRDMGLFEITTGTSNLVFKAAPDFEAPGSGATPQGNTYIVEVTVSDDATPALTDTLTITVTVTDVNDVAPTITSAATGTALTENAEVGASTAIYTAAGTFDVTPIVWSLKAGSDAGLSIDRGTGAVTFDAATTPDYETKASYSFTVVATSGSLAPVEQAVTVAVTDVQESGPTFSSGATGAALDENTEVGTSTAVYAASAAPAVSGKAITYSLKPGVGDIALFGIGGTTGNVTFNTATTPDHEMKASYTFTVIATEADNNVTTEHVVTIAVTDLNDVAPTIDGGATATSTTTFPEGTEITAGTVVYTATGTFDVTAITWTLKPSNSDDASLFRINGSTGVVTFFAAETPDYDTKASYIFTVVATSGTLAAVEQTVTIAVTEVEDNVAPVWRATNSASGTELTGESVSVMEGTTAVKTLFAVDGNSADTLTYALTGAHGSLFMYTASTGALAFKAAPDFEDVSAPANNTYTVTLTVTDSGNPAMSDAITYTVIVTNQPEDGTAADVTGSSATGTGYAVVGDTLTAGAVTDPDGAPTASSLQYQWQVSDDGTAGSWTDIATGGTSATYTVAVAQGKHVRVRTTYTAGGYASSMAFSAAVIIDSTTTGTVTITYTDVAGKTANQADQGEALTAVVTGLTDADDNNLDFAYQWAKNGTNITSADGTTATLLAGTVDADGVYTVVVTATDDMAGVETTFTASINVGVVETGLIKPTADGLTEVDGTSGVDTLTSTSAAEIIQGGDDTDTITAGAGDVIIGGYGSDPITLPITSGKPSEGGGDGTASSETIVYRYGSISNMIVQAVDGGVSDAGTEGPTGFSRGVDKFIFVETGVDWHLTKSDIATKADITADVLLTEFATRNLAGNPIGITLAISNNVVSEGLSGIDDTDGLQDAEMDAGARYTFLVSFSQTGYKYGLSSSIATEATGTTLTFEFDVATTRWLDATSMVSGVGEVYNWDIVTDNIVLSSSNEVFAEDAVISQNGLLYLFGVVDANYAAISGNEDLLQFTLEDGLGVDIL